MLNLTVRRIKKINPVGKSIFKENIFLAQGSGPNDMDLGKLDSLFSVTKKRQPTKGNPSCFEVIVI